MDWFDNVIYTVSGTLASEDYEEYLIYNIIKGKYLENYFNCLVPDPAIWQVPEKSLKFSLC